MTRPTDDELEAMAVLLEAFGTRTGLKDAAAAMLRACKTGDAPTDERVARLVNAVARGPIANEDMQGWIKTQMKFAQALRDMGVRE